jgi:hypothetical protein
MNETNHNDAGGEPDELTGRLDALAERIQCQRYPGSAWQDAKSRAAAGRGIRRIIWPRLVAAAAAGAAVAAAVIMMASYFHGPGPAAKSTPPLPEQVAVAPSLPHAPPAAGDLWNVPTEFNIPAAAANIRMPSADVSMPSDLALVVPGRLDWKTPTISFALLK